MFNHNHSFHVIQKRKTEVSYNFAHTCFSRGRIFHPDFGVHRLSLPPSKGNYYVHGMNERADEDYISIFKSEHKTFFSPRFQLAQRTFPRRGSFCEGASDLQLVQWMLLHFGPRMVSLFPFGREKGSISRGPNAHTHMNTHTLT